jgi:uncharacterized protein (TIGR02271 family)
MKQMENSKTVVGVFDDRATAQRAAQDLVEQGFRRDNITVITKDTLASDAAIGGAGLSGRLPTESGTGGAIGRFFKKLFGADVNEREHGYYTEAIQRGGSFVSVWAGEDDSDRAVHILERYNPIDVDERASASGTRAGEAIPVVEEELQVGKRTVQGGGVRVYSRIVEEPVEEQVTLHEERAYVDRRPVDRPATEADIRRSESTIEVTETSEEPVVGKRARVREEVVIGKESTERTETVRDKVRRTDVQVEQMAGEDLDVDFRNDFRSRYASRTGATYDNYAPAYEYGYRMAGEPRYRGKSWQDVEPTLKTEYVSNRPNSTWEQVKDAVRYGWEKVSGKR